MDDKQFYTTTISLGILALEARKKLIELILRQDSEIQKIFVRAADDLGNEIKRMYSTGSAFRIIDALEVMLRNTAEFIKQSLMNLFDKGLSVSVEAGMHQSKQATLRLLKRGKIDWKPIERTYFRKHTEAVEAMQSRTIKGLNLSDRIWGKSQEARSTMGSIIREAIATGEHPYKVAEMLQQYVRNGAGTLVSNYPKMIERLEGNIPTDLSYESLRLARSEMAAAFGKGVTQSAKLNPSNKGIQWSLSNAGVACHICRERAEHDEGLGAGVYLLETLPDYPAHPNCLCVLSEVVENTDDFLERLIEWNKQPQSQPDLEKWYQTVYKTGEL